MAAESTNGQSRNPTPQEYLMEISGSDFSLLNRIIICESGWHIDAKNKNSTASGLFQFIDSTWNHWGKGNVFDPYDNIIAGVKLFNAEGTVPWDASKTCWNR